MKNKRMEIEDLIKKLDLTPAMYKNAKEKYFFNIAFRHIFRSLINHILRLKNKYKKLYMIFTILFLKAFPKLSSCFSFIFYF